MHFNWINDHIYVNESYTLQQLEKETFDQGLHCLPFCHILDMSSGNQINLFRLWDRYDKG